MPDRLIQILVPADKETLLRELIERVEAVKAWHEPSDNLRLFSIQVPGEQVEAVLNPVQSQFCKTEGFRAVVVPVEAGLPRPEKPRRIGRSRLAGGSRRNRIWILGCCSSL